MRRVVLSVGLATLVGVAAVSSGQPPAPVPGTPPLPIPLPPAGPTPPRVLPPSVTGPAFPAAPPVTPAVGAVPVPAPPAETPLAKFEPLAAFPAPTQAAVRAAVLGSGWLARANQAHGRFLYGYRPALRQPMDGDHDLKQARAALALAQAARFTGDDRQAAVAGQAILALLSATKPDPADPNCRVPVHSSRTCNRVGFAAVLALAIYELPGADDKLIAEAERLGEFLRRHLRTDGSVQFTDGPADAPPDPAGVGEYPGTALHALAVGHRVRPAAWKLDALTRGLAHYRAYFAANPHPLLAATLTPAFAELYLQTKTPAAAAAVFELNDWLADLQYPAGDPRHPAWAGGFRGWAGGRPADAEPGAECGAYLQSLACAYPLAADPDRAAKYHRGLADAAQFVAGLQYAEANTRHFEASFRASVLVGGFYLSPTDGNLRLDAQAWALTGLLRFLGSGAEK